MIWLRVTLNKTTAKSASMNPSGANTERKERSSSKSLAQLLLRKFHIPLTIKFVELNSMVGEKIMTASLLETIEWQSARGPSTTQATFPESRTNFAKIL